MLQKVKANVPELMKGYQASTLVNGVKEASGSFERHSFLAVDIEAKRLELKVIDPPKKDGAQSKTGSLIANIYLKDGKVWVEQKFPNDPIGNWKMPVNVVGASLKGSASEFQYFNMSPQALEKRKNDLTYNLKLRTQEAGFSETPATQYNFVFGFDPETKGLYMDREILAVSTGEKNEQGLDALRNIQVRILLTSQVQSENE
ncbi:MAG: hypothetical protein R3A80_03940 [Bdellovibrionota bacterium]